MNQSQRLRTNMGDTTTNMTNNNNNNNNSDKNNNVYWYLYHFFDVLLLLLLLAVGFGLEFAEPYEKFLNEQLLYRLRYPMKANAVPTALLPFLAIVFPIIIIFALERFTMFELRNTKRNFRRAKDASLGLLLSVALSFIFVNVMKMACGNYRPDFAARCWGAANAEAKWISFGVPDCGGYENSSLLNEVRQGRRSFPSGHTSMSFSGLAYLTMYLLYFLKCFNANASDKRQGAFVWKVLVSLFPLAIAIAVAVTRIRDYWHHPEDVIMGSIIGISTSLFAFTVQGLSVFGNFSSSGSLRARKKYQNIIINSENDDGAHQAEEDETANLTNAVRGSVRHSSMLDLNDMN